MKTDRTYNPLPQEISREWHLIDAQGQILGRLAVQVAKLLRGKHKAIYTPSMDCGDGVVVINAQKIRVSGNKLTTKTYERYSGYPSGLKSETLGHLLDRRPTEPVRRAVVGMLPKNSLGRKFARRLRIYPGETHTHLGQIKKNSNSKASAS